jgi:hypothetical protein
MWIFLQRFLVSDYRFLAPSPKGAARFNTLVILGCLTILVHNISSEPSSGPSPSIYDSTDGAIKQMIDGIERMICLHKRDEREECDGEASTPKTTILINPATKKHCKLQIKTLQTAPRDVAKLKRIIKAKEKKREEDTSMHVVDM